jgi:transposase
MRPEHVLKTWPLVLDPVNYASEIIHSRNVSREHHQRTHEDRGRTENGFHSCARCVRAMNRLECVTEAVRHALNILATVAPGWLRQHSQPEWIDRYGPRAEDARFPTSEADRQTYAQQVGIDGCSILDMISADDAPDWFRKLPALEILRRIWVQQYYRAALDVRWRTREGGLPAAAIFISSPYDAEAHYAKKRTTSWIEWV